MDVMHRKISAIIICLIFIVLISGCCAGSAPKAPTATPGPVTNEGRLLGMDISLPSDNDFGKAYFMAKDAGVRMVQLTPRWDEIEPGNGKYSDPQENLAAAKAFYRQENIRVALAVSPLDTNVNRMPADLKGMPMDDPAVIDRYNKMIDDVLQKLDGVTLQDAAIGNEIDVYLGNDAAKWRQYTNFYRGTKKHLKAARPDLKVGVKATFYGLTRNNVEQLKTLNEESDVILVTYYPLNPDFTVREPSVIKEDFDKICALYPGKEIYFLELGYPSSPLLNSSNEKQAEFVRQAFAAWDEHKGRITVVNFVFMHDPGQPALDTLEKYYGLSDPKFLAYLETLGLRTAGGKDKPAWAAFKEEARARGF
jgi:hypothetical protein